MANLLNLSLVEGNLTRDPELFYTKNGVAVCKFSVAVNYNYKSNDREINEVSFISVDAWNKVADVCVKYLKKGSKVRVKGRLKQDTWVSANGDKKSKLFIKAASVDFLGSPRSKTEEAQKEELAVF